MQRAFGPCLNARSYGRPDAENPIPRLSTAPTVCPAPIRSPRARRFACPIIPITLRSGSFMPSSPAAAARTSPPSKTASSISPTSASARSAAAPEYPMKRRWHQRSSRTTHRYRRTCNRDDLPCRPRSSARPRPSSRRLGKIGQQVQNRSSSWPVWMRSKS